MRSYLLDIRSILLSSMLLLATAKCGSSASTQTGAEVGPALSTSAPSNSIGTGASTQAGTGSTAANANSTGQQFTTATAYSTNSRGQSGGLFFLKGFDVPSQGVVLRTSLPVIEDGNVVTPLNTPIPTFGGVLLVVPADPNTGTICQNNELGAINSSACSITYSRIEVKLDPSGVVRFTALEGTYTFDVPSYGTLTGSFVAVTPPLSTVEPDDFSQWLDSACVTSSYMPK